MENTKENLRRAINIAAQNFLAPQEDGDLYDAYTKLKDVQKLNYGERFASYFVDIPKAFVSLSVDNIVDLIEASIVVNAPEVPEFIQGIDWDLLKAQKASLLKVIEDTDNVSVLEHLEGIVVLIDALQDYACDTLGLGETLVFPELGKEDKEPIGSPWSEIHNDFEDEGIVSIDAWTTADDNEGGSVIAHVNTKTGVVEYHDERAKTDSFAQEAIQEVLNKINKPNVEKQWTCTNCGSTDVEIKRWVNPNTDEVGVDCEEDAYCNACQDHHRIELQ